MPTTIKDVDTAHFEQEVIQRSHELPVVVDFWAEWCGPCKTLGPMLENVTGEYEGAFELAKVDVDSNQQLAAQMGVQGIPTVVAFVDGAPAHRFTGAIPEPQLRQWLAEFVSSPLDQKVEAALKLAEQGDLATARTTLESILADDDSNVDAGTALAALLIDAEDADGALRVLDGLQQTEEVIRLQAVARVAGSPVEDLAVLERRVQENPNDSGVRVDLGRGLIAAGRHEEGLDTLLEVVASGDGHAEEARKAMLDAFSVLGPESDLTAAYRRHLANAIF